MLKTVWEVSNRIGVAAALVFAALLVACAQSNPDAERTAYEDSKPWLRLLDNGDYAQCWQVAAPMFRHKESLEGWIAKAQSYREPLGAFGSRQLNTARYLVDPWGWPAGEYVAVVYDSHWQAGSIYESVNMQKQADGSWLMVGYDVQPQ